MHHLFSSQLESCSQQEVNRLHECSRKIQIQKYFVISVMPFHRNFTYWIDKRRWKYCFLLAALAMDKS